ncbi:translation initiation factor IF-2 subunit gamma [Caldivirga sp. UBA161]|uniref:translation initiation factor IF-2 subunit gamma n=1 Tax=Caldivirga sp. UBA161 TaxID=1915569 RepID=UPI0025BC885B|nr:translation initiation factor IF-2 subunit gamma [Caldivirga sp. UBA161]
MQEYTYPDSIVITAGHVDHGKTTVVQALSSEWVARHSEEIKRAMTIKLGYTNIDLYECGGEYPIVPIGLIKDGKCPDGSEAKFVRRISILDAPGHEVLLSTMISGISFVDGALMVIDASTQAPQPQTEEHFIALTIMDTKSLIIAQNKIDLVNRDKAIENYMQIRNFIKGTWAEGAPIIPMSALHKVNIDALASTLNNVIKPKVIDLSKPPIMYILRSFNVNKPGTPPSKLMGGVIGGTLLQGRIRVNDEIEIRPGLKLGDKYMPIRTKVTSIAIGNQLIEEARPGGLVGIGTLLDPALTKADALVGSVVGEPGKLAPVYGSIDIEYHLISRRGVDSSLKVGEPVMIIIGSASVMGIVRGFRGDSASIDLRRGVCAQEGAKLVVIKQVMGRWRIVGWGKLKGGKVILD